MWTEHKPVVIDSFCSTVSRWLAGMHATLLIIALSIMVWNRQWQGTYHAHAHTHSSVHTICWCEPMNFVGSKLSDCLRVVPLHKLYRFSSQSELRPFVGNYLGISFPGEYLGGGTLPGGGQVISGLLVHSNRGLQAVLPFALIVSPFSVH